MISILVFIPHVTVAEKRRGGEIKGRRREGRQDGKQ